MKMTPYLQVLFSENDIVYYVMNINNEYCVNRFNSQSKEETFFKFKTCNSLGHEACDKALFDFMFSNRDEGSIILRYNDEDLMETFFDENAKQDDQTRQEFYEHLNILKHLQMGELYTDLYQEIKNLYFQFIDSNNADL